MTHYDDPKDNRRARFYARQAAEDKKRRTRDAELYEARRNALVRDAARAVELFDEDELEAYAQSRR